MLKVSMVELYQEAENFLNEHFGLSLEVPIRVAARMTRTMGCFKHYRSWNRPIEIKLSEKMLTHHDPEVSIDVLRHELIHYALYMLQQPYKDKDENFKSTCRRLGVALTRTYQFKGEIYTYGCASGCSEWKFKTRRNFDRHHCRKCKKHIVYKGEKVIA
ncbi:SprT-like domain-containing protein [Fictibacillus sp. NRS-1165]|uniref:SprT family zinc-dependent metalloprotease n=1 Tax=Fictibacillus sp. NRS-1165 TaxID=3144463 RepID=UPI003D1FF504